MNNRTPKYLETRPGERSFTLFETIVAIAILVAIIFEVSSVQANSIVFSEYERRSTQAIWYAKGVMSNIEYQWYNTPFKEMEQRIEEKRAEDIPIDAEAGDYYTYDVEIKEWKLPLIDMLTGGGKRGEDGEESGGGEGDLIREQLKKFLGDDILKTATVNVYWPEGAIRNNVSLTMLLTNQNKLDETIKSLPPVKQPKKEENKKLPKKKSTGKKGPGQQPSGAAPQGIPEGGDVEEGDE